MCVVTSGPGLTNIATAVGQAYSDSVPLLVISPGMPAEVQGGDRGYLHEMKSQVGMMSNIAAWSHRARAHQDAVDALGRTLRSSLRHGHGPCMQRYLSTCWPSPDGSKATSSATPAASRRPSLIASRPRRRSFDASRLRLWCSAGRQESFPAGARTRRASRSGSHDDGEREGSTA